MVVDSSGRVAARSRGRPLAQCIRISCHSLPKQRQDLQLIHGSRIFRTSRIGQIDHAMPAVGAKVGALSTETLCRVSCAIFIGRTAPSLRIQLRGRGSPLLLLRQPRGPKDCQCVYRNCHCPTDTVQINRRWICPEAVAVVHPYGTHCR